MPRLLPFLLLLAACQAQPHHDSPPAGLRATIDRALAVCLREQGVDPATMAPPDRRRLGLRAAVLTAHAQDDAAAVAAIRDGRLGEDRLRALSDEILHQLLQRQGDLRPEPVHLQLLRRDGLDTDARILLRVLLREQVIANQLNVPEGWEAPPVRPGPDAPPPG